MLHYYNEDDEYINAECAECKKVLKIPRKYCVQTNSGYAIAPVIKCKCNIQYAEIAKQHTKIDSATKLASNTSNALLTINAVTMVIKYDGKRVIISEKSGCMGCMITTTSINITDIGAGPFKEATKFRPGRVWLNYTSTTNNKLISKEVLFDVTQNNAIKSLIDEIKSYVWENRAQCNQCHHVWFFTEIDVLDAKAKSYKNAAKNLFALGAFLPLALIPDEKINDPKRCPKCGSRTIETKLVVNKRIASK